LDKRSERYQRQQRLPQIGAGGQVALSKATIGVIGLGALGSVSADLLARAGVGELRLIDRDIVEWSNLQRQSLYTERDADLAVLKAEAAANYLAQVNSELTYRPLAIDLSSQNIEASLDGCSLVIDGTDNFSVRYLLNDWAVKTATPLIYAGAVATYGMTGAILPGGACLRCTWPEPPSGESAPTCRSAGVISPIIHSIAASAVTEALKVLVGDLDAVNPGYFMQDLWRNDARSLRASKDPECPCCAKSEYNWLNGERDSTPIVMCGNDSVQFPPNGNAALAELAAKLDGTVEVICNSEHLLRFKVCDLEILRFADGRTLVRGTNDPARARSIISRSLGS